ncbi:hypothetical protein COO55_38420 [Rhodococcus opacus]|nr:hypothetical protein COO55_38420 [Rhodococcus opacus]
MEHSHPARRHARHHPFRPVSEEPGDFDELSISSARGLVEAGPLPIPGVEMKLIKEQFAAYKHPRIIEFATFLPMTSTGKILKRELT